MKTSLSKIKYPKLLLLLLTFFLAYLIFAGKTFLPLCPFLFNLGYFGIFLMGIFFAYGFTAAPAMAMLLILSDRQNILFTGFTAGLGALVGDLIIFKFIRHSFADEIKKLSKEKPLKKLNNKMPDLLKKYLVPALAGFVIASPLPDEIGVSLLAASFSVSTKTFLATSYTLNTMGIFAILLIGNAI